MSTQYPLTKIAAAQVAGFTHAFDRGSKQRELARRQRIYAARRADLDAVLFFSRRARPNS